MIVFIGASSGGRSEIEVMMEEELVDTFDIIAEQQDGGDDSQYAETIIIEPGKT